MPYEVPIDERFRGPIEMIVTKLAAGDLEGLVGDGQLAAHALGQVATLIAKTGVVLGALPVEWWQDSEAFMFPVREPEEWCALVPLWTRDGRRTPLGLEVDLYAAVGGPRAIIERVFVAPPKM
jgi:hypothetical protein